MTDISFKQMTLADIDEVVALESQSFDHPWSKQSFLEELENPVAYYLLAVMDGMLVGYAGMWVILDEAHITNVAISPTHRKQGFGEVLMQEAIRIVKEKKVTAMTLEVRPSNVAALALYHKLGFILQGIRKNYYEDTHEDALIMWTDWI